MPKKRHSAEEIIGELREVEVLVDRGGSLGEAIRSIGVTDQKPFHQIVLVPPLDRTPQR